MKIDFTKDSRDFLLDLKTLKHFRQIVAKILAMLQNPYPSDSMELHGYDARRVSVGEFRIIYRQNIEEDMLQIILIGRRNDDDIYRNLKR